ncbi:hypothetical protein SB761_37225, partial [Pseudomonas sp. SIMBA_064]
AGALEKASLARNKCRSSLVLRSAAQAALDLRHAARLKVSTPVALTVSFPHNPATDIEKRRDWGDL